MMTDDNARPRIASRRRALAPLVGLLALGAVLALTAPATAIPDADAGPDAAITVENTTVAPNETVTLNGTVSETPWAMPALYAWDVGADDGEDEEWEHEGEHSTHHGSLSYGEVDLAFEEPGLYPVQLEITDNWAQTDTTIDHIAVSVDANNTPPDASFYADDPDVRLNTSFTLHATSRDADGFVQTHRWDVDGDGEWDATGDTLEMALHDNDSDGRFETTGDALDMAFDEDDNETAITLLAQDDSGGYDTVTHTIEVLEGDDRETDSGHENVYAPEAAFTVHDGGDGVTVNETVTLDAEPSMDRAGTVVHYIWDTDDDGDWEHDKADDYDGTMEYQQIDVTFEEPGVHPVTVKAMDEHGAVDETKRAIHVAPNDTAEAPTTRIETSSTAGEATLLSANVSGGDANVTEYEWDTDGDGICDAMGAHTAMDEVTGDTVRLKITTSDGATAWNSTTLEDG